MAEIRALVVDDEPLARRGVRQLLAAHPDIRVVGESRDGRDAVRALETLKPDLVFLDVQMPGLDGFGVVRVRGADRMPATVFVTAHDEFAVRAFETNALDYLVKPLSQSRFDATVRRVRERLRLATAAEYASRLAAAAGRLRVPTATGELYLDTTDIDWIEARDDYAAIHSKGQRFLVREALSSLERRLDPGAFFRSHRSAIVRLERVREIANTAAVLRDGTRVPVSRRRLAELRAMLRR